MSDKYPVIISNRATGILFNFLQKKRNGEKVTWYLPSTCCHIVPCCFFKAGLSVKFYDYALTKNPLLVTDEAPKGVLLVDYNGNELYTKEDLLELRKTYDYIIYDKCLSFIDFSYRSSAVDLILFSTGYSKPLDFNYGGIGIQNSSYKVDEPVRYNPHALSDLNEYWKKNIHKGNDNTFLEIVQEGWIDMNSNLVPFDYQKRIDFYTPIVKRVKEEMNEIYRELIPQELWMSEDQAIWRFNLYVDSPAYLLEKLSRNNLFASNHYRSCARFFYNEEKPNSDFIEKHTVNLFNDFRVTANSVEQTAEIIKKTFHKKKIKAVECHNLRKTR